MASTLRETVSVRQIDARTFEAPPYYDRAVIGNALPIVYGGQTLSQAVTSGYATISEHADEFQLYSVKGAFLGPASTQHPIVFTVQLVRTTRTFLTRFVTASQRGREILIVILDWHKPESPLLEYSVAPIWTEKACGKPDEWPTYQEHVNHTLPPAKARLFDQYFHVILEFFDFRWITESYGAKNVLGWHDPGVAAGPEENKSPLDKTNSAWCKSTEALNTPALKNAALAYLLDSGLAFLPLTFAGLPLTATGAASSLDFSLQIHDPPDLSDWSMLEHHTEHAAHGRTFSVGRLYDSNFKLKATMSQCCILRKPSPKPSRTSKL